MQPVKTPLRNLCWRWRLRAVRRLAAALDPAESGVRGLYLTGSVKNAAAGLHSDIDLIIHVNGTPAQLKALNEWLAGWNRRLAASWRRCTGVQVDSMLDPHFITASDLACKRGFAARIGAVDDPAWPLPMAGPADDDPSACRPGDPGGQIKCR